jgi:hypothetical protein
MRKTLVAIAGAAAVLSLAALTPNRAEAMTLPAPAGLAAAAEGLSPVEQAAVVCRYHRCWVVRRYWRPHRYYRPYRYYHRRYYRPYRYYRPHRYYRPYRYYHRRYY